MQLNLCKLSNKSEFSSKVCNTKVENKEKKTDQNYEYHESEVRLTRKGYSVL